MTPTWLLATTNPAKRRELLALLGELPVNWRWLGEFPGRPRVEETGQTLEENALIKARAYTAWSGLPALADDGGLEIDALGGEPGVRSRRWPNGVEASDEALIAYALERMQGIPEELRGAQFRVALALAFPDGRLFQGTGVSRGVIARTASPTRDPGFPYRSIFYLPDLRRYSVDLAHDDQSQVSHRRTARTQLLASLPGEPSTRH
jgi:XTP/dITP diphosphohydrolase